METEFIINEMCPNDWEQVKSIYLEGINTGNATFQNEAPSWEDWNNNHLSECRFVARLKGSVIGWTALTPISSRCVYSGVAEVSVYVSDNARGLGVGSELLKALIEKSEQQGYWTLQSGIFPENIPSLKLHHKFGFREVGRREHIGKMNGVWRDVLLLERRSKIVGID
ncbi:N-acetyltransferase family protein [Neobacillus sp.]|uniref:GNAT family N-acetyltransferase n=1 Tax=Neobacillus sp. TaxID=2675273 RepID=UPI0028A1F7A6|nr:N-acetyltransferase family protein [Neobacillus sp.]